MSVSLIDGHIDGMTPQEALEILCKGIAPNPTANNECIKLCKQALEKQIPKKPFVPWDSLNKTPYCPNCEENVWGCDAYCDHCGQALDWSDTE